MGRNYAAFRARAASYAPGVTGPFGGAAAVCSLLGLDGRSDHQCVRTSRLDRRPAPGRSLARQRSSSSSRMGRSLGYCLPNWLAVIHRATPDGLAAADGGLFMAYSDGGDPDAMLEGLARWEPENITLRPSPAAAYLQGVVTAVLRVVTQARPGSPTLFDRCASAFTNRLQVARPADPKDRFQSRLSARYVAAVVLADRTCWMEQFSAERFADASLQRFAHERVETEERSNGRRRRRDRRDRPRRRASHPGGGPRPEGGSGRSVDVRGGHPKIPGRDTGQVGRRDGRAHDRDMRAPRDAARRSQSSDAAPLTPDLCLAYHRQLVAASSRRPSTRCLMIAAYRYTTCANLLYGSVT